MSSLAATGADRDAASGGIEALIERAVRLEHGEGVTRNALQAAELYCSAIRQGSAEAAYRLGWMYANGRGFGKDEGHAVALFQRAAAQGHEYAGRMLARIRSDNARLPECVATPMSGLLAKAELEIREQLTQADRVRLQSTLAELAKAEQHTQAERIHAESARLELAKVGQAALEERGKADAAAAELERARLAAQSESTRAESLKAQLAKVAQSVQADRAATEATSAALAKAQQEAQAERAKVVSAQAELARVQQQVQAERARAESVRVELAKAERASPAQAVQAVPAVNAPTIAPSEPSAVVVALENWAAAWSRKDVDAYIAAYARDFVVPGGQSQRQWERNRRARILNKAWIAVKLHNLDINVDGSLARARFVQEYRSDKLIERGAKTLTLVKHDRMWVIRQEQSAQ